MSLEDPPTPGEPPKVFPPPDWEPNAAHNPPPAVVHNNNGRQLLKAFLVIVAFVGAIYGYNRYQEKKAEEKSDRDVRALVDAIDLGDTDTPSATHTVTYKTSGTALYGSITYETPSGTSQQTDVDIPLTPKTGAKGAGISFTMNDGDFVYLAIQNGTDSGSVTCIIEVDGVEVATNTSRGAYAIADCSGSV